jgi:prepilin-type N-terminal cleavage/methylation domain-containing protein
MKKNNRRNQRGFTLIELLVVIAILAVLFGVTALALNGVGSNATQVTKDAEKDIVQTAIDVYMAQNNVSTVTGNVGPAPSKVVGPASGDQFSSLLRRDSKYLYCWNTNGNITRQDTAAAACP